VMQGYLGFATFFIKSMTLVSFCLSFSRLLGFVLNSSSL
jgi:hypothetical protein